MNCGLLPLSVDAMALGDVPFLQADVQLNQLQESLGSVGKVCCWVILFCCISIRYSDELIALSCTVCIKLASQFGADHSLIIHHLLFDAWVAVIVNRESNNNSNARFDLYIVYVSSVISATSVTKIWTTLPYSPRSPGQLWFLGLSIPIVYARAPCSESFLNFK